MSSETIFELLTEAEVQLLLDSARDCNPYYYVLLTSLYLTGSRVTPVLLLKKEDVKLKDKVIQLPKCKGLELSIPIDEKLSAILEQFLANHPEPRSPFLFHSPMNPDRPINQFTLRTHIKKIKEKAGIEKSIPPLILRASVVSHRIS